jgi:putative Mg2+ transporter-C (MgtC) family protein
MDMFSLGHDHFYFIYLCLFAIIVGGLVGYEREKRGKPAGLKTHTLICLGSMMITYLSMKGGNAGDPTRIAAQIVSGIGFIGAGTIMQSKSVITGLTSASTIWVVAGLGMLIGANFHMEATTVTILVLIFLDGYRYFTRQTGPVRFYCLNIEINRVSALEKIEDMVDKFGLGLKDKQLTKSSTIHLELSYTTNSLTQHIFLKRLLRLHGVGQIVTA